MLLPSNLSITAGNDTQVYVYGMADINMSINSQHFIQKFYVCGRFTTQLLGMDFLSANAAEVDAGNRTVYLNGMKVKVQSRTPDRTYEKYGAGTNYIGTTLSGGQTIPLGNIWERL